MNTTITKDVVSVTDMARMVGLSRARFYELMQRGVFPPPSRSPTTKRPLYARDQQEQCLQIRRTHRGANGETILFYAVAPRPSPPPKRSAKSGPKESPPARQDDLLNRLRDSLSQLGVVDLAETQLRSVLAAEWPAGHADVDEATLVTTVYRSLKCRNPRDNVAR
jgi:hypothetical protein